MNTDVSGQRSIPSGVFDSVYKHEVEGNINSSSIESGSVPFDEPSQPIPPENPSTEKSSKHNSEVRRGDVELAKILRECANYVEKGEFNPIILKALGALHAYSGEKTDVNMSINTKTSSFDENEVEVTIDESSNNTGKSKQGMYSSNKSLNTEDKNKVRETAKHFASNFGSIGKNAKKIWSSHTKFDPSKRQTKEENGGNYSADEPSFASRHSNESSNNTDQPSTPHHLKPSFQRPINSNSNLIANGWIEQQRRSKMRVVWKEVLASLVSARKAGEETTLWIQRQVISQAGRAELEALHQVPMKWLEDVSYIASNNEHRIVLKVFNITEEFLFRCMDYESAQNWVLTLRSACDRSIHMPTGNGHKNSNDPSSNDASGSSRQARSGGGNIRRTSSTPTRQRSTPVKQGASHNNFGSMSIKELKAIARDAGIDTFGMERADLEKIAAKHMSKRESPKPKGQSSIPPPPPAPQSSRGFGDRSNNDSNASRQRDMSEQGDQRRAMEFAAADRRRQEQEEAAARDRLRQQENAAAQERRRQQEETERSRIAKERIEEERRRQQQEQAAAQERVRQQQEQAAAQERMRQQQEQAAAQERMRQEHAAAQERIRQQKEQAAAHERMRQQQEQERLRQQQEQERLRQQQEQQWRQQQEWQKQQWHNQQQSQQQFFNQQQQQQQFYSNGTNQGPQPHQQQQQQQQGADPSQYSSKYAKAMSEEDSGQAAITALKRNILINWALQPPNLNSLRPIHHLVCSIHRVFPPSFGVNEHAHFSKWKPITATELQISGVMNNTPDEEKLKKSVRKIRFFLHPDKLPKDLDEQQQFMCKMLWDVTSDAWEEHKTKSEELDWVSP